MNRISHIIGWIIMAFAFFVLIAMVSVTFGLKRTLFSLIMTTFLILALWLITR